MSIKPSSAAGSLAVLIVAGTWGLACGTSKPADATTTSKSVGSAGGTVNLGNQVTVIIPAGALPDAQMISVSSGGTPPPEYAHASVVFQFGPAGLHFAMPVQVTLPVPAGASTPGIFWSRDGAAGFDRVGGARTGGTITAAVTHFSEGFVADEVASGGDASTDGPSDGVDVAGEASTSQMDAPVVISDAGTADVADAISAAGTGDAAAPILVAPLSTATVTSRRPTLRWTLASGTDGAHVLICRDRACASPVLSFDAAGKSGAPSADLPSGMLFWRAYGRSNGVTGQLATPTWQFLVGARTAPVDTSSGTTLDVNGDGYADVITGEMLFGDGGGAPGLAQVFQGGPSGLGSSPATTLSAPVDVANFGYSVASAGDVNGDGFADVVIGTRVGERAYVYLGSATGLASSPAASLVGPDGIQASFGLPVASAGDVNGDGYADIIVGAFNGNKPPGPTAIGTGRAYVYLGSATGVAANPAVTLTGQATGSGFGWSVASADVNGDGYADVIVGSAGGYGGRAGVPLSRQRNRAGDIPGRHAHQSHRRRKRRRHLRLIRLVHGERG